MTMETFLLVGIAGMIALLAQSVILYAAVGMAGGEFIEERNSFLTAVFVTILLGLLGLGLRVLLVQDVISRTAAGFVLVPAWFLVVMLAYRMGLLRAFLVLLVQAVLGCTIFLVLRFYLSMFGLFSGLGRIFPAD